MRQREAIDREVLGRVVREAWEKWASEQEDRAEHPDWLTPWDELDERMREVDRQIGERVYGVVWSEIGERLEAKLKEHGKNIRVWYGMDEARDPVWRLIRILHDYHQTATRTLAGQKAFRDDILIWLRALAMTVDMTGNAATHAEKNARLRGMSDLIESAIHKLRGKEFAFNDTWWHLEDVFRSDYPVREYVRRIHELEDEVKRWKRQAGEEVEDEIDPERMPF